MVDIPILMGRLYKYSNKKVPIYLCSDFAKNGASKYIGTFFTRLSKCNGGPIKIGWLIFKRVRRLDNPRLIVL